MSGDIPEINEDETTGHTVTPYAHQPSNLVTVSAPITTTPDRLPKQRGRVFRSCNHCGRNQVLLYWDRDAGYRYGQHDIPRRKVRCSGSDKMVPFPFQDL